MALSTVVNAELAAWVKTCPTPLVFATAIADAVWRQQKATCFECGYVCTNDDLRPDDAYFGSGNPICRGCYEFHNSGTPARPNFHAEWPAERGVGRLVDGELWSGAGQVGVVSGYDPDSHFANLVTLFGLEDCAEGGSVDPRHTVKNTTPHPMSNTSEGRDAIVTLLVGHTAAAAIV